MYSLLRTCGKYKFACVKKEKNAAKSQKGHMQSLQNIQYIASHLILMVGYVI